MDVGDKEGLTIFPRANVDIIFDKKDKPLLLFGCLYKLFHFGVVTGIRFLNLLLMKSAWPVS